MNVSVIIPFFNTKKDYLIELFKCIEESKKDNLEFIFVNDGSNVETKNYVLSFTNKHNFKFIDILTNQGVSNARNVGIENASNDFIMFVDSDDYADFSFVNNLKSIDNCDLYLFKDAIMKIDNFSKNTEPIYIEEKNNLLSMYENDSDGFNLRSSCCKVLSKKTIQENNLKFDITLPFYEDAMFMTNYYLKCNNPLFFNNIIYYYRLHSNSSSKRFNRDYFKKYSLYFEKYKNIFLNYPNLVNSLYKDTFNKVLVDKFTKSFKSFRFLYAFKMLKLPIISETARYILNNKDSFQSSDLVLANYLNKRKFILAFSRLVFLRISLSLSSRIRRLFHK